MLSVVILTMLLVILGGFGWWAAQRIDNEARNRQALAVTRGLASIMARLSVEQDSSAIWNDAVINLRAGNDAWIADNLAEWVSSYFGHNRVYLIAPDNRPVRAVSEGLRQADSFYERDQRAVEPLVLQLRDAMAEASAGQADSTEAVTGLGVADLALMGDGTAGIVSIRPVVPEADEDVLQSPGTEFLHVSIRLIDSSLSADIAETFDIDALEFHTRPVDDNPASVPVANNAGATIGHFAWEPRKPALQLIQETAPVLALCMMVVALLLTLLLRRLKRTSTQLQSSEAHARYLAFHDPLAGIPNRALFEDRLRQAIVNRRHSGAKLAIHSIDIDRFKQVNDTLGHPAGDELIRQVGARLSSLVTDIDTVARLGGDEFAIVQVDIGEVGHALQLAQRIVAELGKPFELLGHEASVSASVGLVYSNDAAHDSDDLLRQTDIALYEAKTSGRSRFQLFAGELDQAIRERRQLEIDLRNALNGEPGLELVYQPIYDASEGGIVGAEALVRWQHPTLGRLSPDKFIGLAEERGLIDHLGLWVLREAAGFAKKSSVPWVAINVSPVQFLDDRFSERVFAILEQTGVDPGRLEIEITEGLLLQNSASVQSTLRQLRAGGIRVALDDFGTGYSSISYLRKYGVDKLKIDQSFVAQLGRDTEIDSIVRSIIELARAMRMKVTAEGVETSGQQAMLRKMNCDQLQGYLLSRPITPQQLNDLLDVANFAKAVSAE